MTLPSDSNCPYVGLAAPQGRPGTIVILGHTDHAGWFPSVTEYGMAGFAEDIDAPIRDRALPDVENYFVLFGRPMEE